MRPSLALVLGLLAMSAPAADPKPAPDNVAANVNGEVIRIDEIDAVVRRRPPGGVPLSASQTRRLRLAVLDGLIDDVLLKQFLGRTGPAVEPAEIDRLMGGLAAAQRKRGKSLADYYREAGRTEAEVREAWTTMLQFQKYAESKATDAELKAYHAANRDFFDGTTVAVRHVVVRVPAGTPPGETAAAVQKLAALKADIAAGKLTFADAAKKYSVDPSAAAGGDAGVIGRKDPRFDDAFTRAAFALKPGTVSDPVVADGGVHLILVTARTEKPAVSFERIADLVRECFAEELRERIVTDLRKAATVQVLLP